MNNYCVITTISAPTKAIEELHKHFGCRLIVVGDEKTPKDWEYKDTFFISEVDKPYAPENHYARKNIGYLSAIASKAQVIYDTDDDNIPNDKWKVRELNIEANESKGEGWYNVYNVLGNGRMWPRGFSLKHLNNVESVDGVKSISSSIQQGLADGEPDVDAIWRLVFKRYDDCNFKRKFSVYVRPKQWCPFNSQSTWWFPKAYPLMYLPVYATFRMTDIWRSLIAQRCLWEIGEGVTFHSPSEVFQDRNEHDLLSDFESEVPGYLKNDKIVEVLSSVELKHGEECVCENLITCYAALANNGILGKPILELDSVIAWVQDYENITKSL